MAEALATAHHAPLVASTTSRLLIDLNRSIGHPHVFSSVTRTLPAARKAQIIAEHYRPHRDEVESLVEQAVLRDERVVHIASHSFTPELGSVVRAADVGLLYDPGRYLEVEISACWKKSLATRSPKLRVRRNYPYAGKSDGLTAHLRKRFPPNAYAGIELEVNQRIVLEGGLPWTALRGALIETLSAEVARQP